MAGTSRTSGTTGRRVIAGLLAAVLLLAGCASPGSRYYGSGTHTVRKGDTLYSIAKRYGRTTAQLSAWNNLRRPSEISIGQVLRLGPPSSTRRGAPVVSGTTPASKPVTTPKAATTSKPATQASKTTPAPAAKTATERANAEKINWMWPVKGKVSKSTDRNKKGVDISGKAGQPIAAAADGQVIYAGRGIRGYGEMVILKHGNAWLSVYAHNDRLDVKEGQQVKRGHRIASMGNTDSDRVKLYFELRRNGDPVDPTQFMPKI